MVDLGLTHNRFAERLHPADAALVMIDCQHGLIDRLGQARREVLCNNLIGLGRLAHAFGLPAVLGARPAPAHGIVLGDLTALFGANAVVERSAGGFWNDAQSCARVRATGRRDVVLAAIGPTTDLMAVALGFQRDGWGVHVVLDASATGDAMMLRLAVERLNAEGVRITNWVAVLAELTAMAAETSADAAAAVRDNLARYSAGPAFHALGEDVA